jgi:oligopeptidase B
MGLVLLLAVLSVSLLLVACASQRTGGFLARPPMAARVPRVLSLHGDDRVDEYYWMRERKDPAVAEYLRAENNYTQAAMAHCQGMQEKLYGEILGRIQETDLSVPVRDGDFDYFLRTVEGLAYPVYCRRRAVSGAAEPGPVPEQVLLDPNVRFSGSPYVRIGAMAVSPDHTRLAYCVDTVGGERYELRFKDLTLGVELAEFLADCGSTVAWAADSATLFYTRLDAACRPHQLRRRRWGGGEAGDELVHQEDDERFFLRTQTTRSKRFVLFYASSQITSEVHFLDARDAFGAFRAIEPRRQGVEYEVEHHGETFLITTNDAAVNFRLMETSLAAPGRENWREVIAHRDDVMLSGVDAFADHLVIYERVGGLPQFRVRDVRSGEEHHVSFPEPAYAAHPGENPEFDRAVLRFHYTSLVTPMSVFDYDMRTRRRELRKQQEVLGGYDPLQYQSQRLGATARDGTTVPISLVIPRKFPRDGSGAVLLIGYGSYGINCEPIFQSQRLSLLDRGVGIAIAHVRGGGELGRRWYEDGKLLKKMNTFTDFIDCAEHLIRSGYCAPNRLAITGGSAGGMLVGAVANMRPDLFQAVLAQVPFVDVLTTILDESLPLTMVEREEWGNPLDKVYYDCIKGYSPYDNIARQRYPHMMITCGLYDPRVQYWEPAKWTARLRALKQDDNLLLLKTNMEAGHGGASGRYERLREIAFEYAFLLDCLRA